MGVAVLGSANGLGRSLSVLWPVQGFAICRGVTTPYKSIHTHIYVCNHLQKAVNYVIFVCAEKQGGTEAMYHISHNINRPNLFLYAGVQPWDNTKLGT